MCFRLAALVPCDWDGNSVVGALGLREDSDSGAVTEIAGVSFSSASRRISGVESRLGFGAPLIILNLVSRFSADTRRISSGAPSLSGHESEDSGSSSRWL
jgi:hypothetical protein